MLPSTLNQLRSGAEEIEGKGTKEANYRTASFITTVDMHSDLSENLAEAYLASSAALGGKGPGIPVPEGRVLSKTDLTSFREYEQAIFSDIDKAIEGKDWVRAATTFDKSLGVPLQGLFEELSKEEPDITALTAKAEEFREVYSQHVRDYPQIYPQEAHRPLIGLDSLTGSQQWATYREGPASSIVKQIGLLSAINGGDGTITTWAEANMNSTNDSVREAAVSAYIYSRTSDPDMRELNIQNYMDSKFPDRKAALPDKTALTVVETALGKHGDPFIQHIELANLEGNSEHSRALAGIRDGLLHQLAAKGESDRDIIGQQADSVAQSLGLVMQLPGLDQGILVDPSSMPGGQVDFSGKLMSYVDTWFGEEKPTPAQFAYEIETSFMNALKPGRSGIDLSQTELGPYKDATELQDPISRKVYSILNRFMDADQAYKVVSTSKLDSDEHFKRMSNFVWSEKEKANVHALKVPRQILSPAEYDGWLRGGGDSSAFDYVVPRDEDGEPLFYVRADELYKDAQNLWNTNNDRIQHQIDFLHSGHSGFFTLGLAPKYGRKLEEMGESQTAEVLKEAVPEATKKGAKSWLQTFGDTITPRTFF